MRMHMRIFHRVGLGLGWASAFMQCTAHECATWSPQVIYLKSKDSHVPKGTDDKGFSFVAHLPLEQEPLIVQQEVTKRRSKYEVSSLRPDIAAQ